PGRRAGTLPALLPLLLARAPRPLLRARAELVSLYHAHRPQRPPVVVPPTPARGAGLSTPGQPAARGGRLAARPATARRTTARGLADAPGRSGGADQSPVVLPAGRGARPLLLGDRAKRGGHRPAVSLPRRLGRPLPTLHPSRYRGSRLPRPPAFLGSACPRGGLWPLRRRGQDRLWRTPRGTARQVLAGHQLRESLRQVWPRP